MHPLIMIRLDSLRKALQILLLLKILTPDINKVKTRKNVQVILWTLDNGNTINSLELDNSNSECYYFERLERVLATQVWIFSRENVLISVFVLFCDIS